MRVTVLLLLTAWAGAARAQVNLDIVTILEQFVTAEAAAKLCGAPAKSSDTFLRNRSAVTVRAMQALVERNSTVAPDTIKAMEAARIVRLAEAASTLVQRRGCSDPGIVLLLKRYEMQSSIDFGSVAGLLVRKCSSLF